SDLGHEPESEVWGRRRRVTALASAHVAVFAHQVHGAQVAVWEDGAATPDDYVKLSGDALITSQWGAALFIQTADCQSVLLVDPVLRVVANIHSGWRGSIANVIGHTVDTMKRRFGCRPSDLRCGIGPSLGPCCAEFIHYRQEIPEKYWRYRYQENLFDFWRLSTDQLITAGVPLSQIELSGICTRCNQHLFFSYRGEGTGAGRFAAVIALTASKTEN
ncbi:MAG: polyphenol oxidase family protein, partial [Desulfobacteraceae bacterium]|nr:polyphenol oxidase family protein [Desulfobacteraceae bacterium]